VCVVTELAAGSNNYAALTQYLIQTTGSDGL